MKYSLDILNRLDQIQEDKDIKSLSYAIYPGTHCPLFGVALTASYIRNMAIVVVGTSECTYYTKNFAYHRQKGNDKVYSLVLQDKDIVFGAAGKVKEGVEAIAKMEELEAIMIVSTCVPELIGEDYVGLKEELRESIGIPVFVVQTEHFKCNSHIPGMTRALKALVEVMEPIADKKGINILGHRQEGREETEIMKIMKKYDVVVHTVIPSRCSLDEVQAAAGAKVNIVTDHIALELAEAMKKKFDIPYVYFDKHMNLDKIEGCYNQLEQLLEVPFSKELGEKVEEYNRLFEMSSKLLQGKRLVYGNTPMMALETVDFLSELGLEPIFVQIRELYEQDLMHKENLLTNGYNPYISRIANIAPLRELYDQIGGDIYVGHENPMLLREKGLLQITFDGEAQKIGYELPIGMMKHILHLLQSEGQPKGRGMYHGNL